MRILVAPQEFKGSLTAHEAAAAVGEGLRLALPDAEVRLAPMADGGPGTLDVIREALGGTLVDGAWSGPMGEPVGASYLVLPESPERVGTAVVESAATAGLQLVLPVRRDPGRASSFGVGQQIARAVEGGAQRVLVGIGGTGTNDGGAGAMQALGYRLLDMRGHQLAPGPLALHWLSRIDASGVPAGLREVEVLVAADVTSPLLGREGATAVFGPQKGVNRSLAARIESALAHFAAICRRDLGVDIAAVSGGGAGGGLAAGLVAACGARIQSGAAVVADAIGLRASIEACDVVVTGEGHLDGQTGRGKAVAHVASLARAVGRPCYAVVGAAEPDVAVAGLAAVEAAQGALSPAEAISRGRELVRSAAERLGRRIEAPQQGR